MKNKILKRLIDSGMTIVAVISFCTTSQVLGQGLEPFTFRAPLEPYQILQLPDFLMQSRQRSDLVIQRSVFAPGPGGWHIHPGPSFIYVIEGLIKLQKFSEKDGCYETPVYGPGQAYFEVGEQIHRAVVVSDTSAVLLVVRFNVPVGGPLSTAVPNPGCPLPSDLVVPAPTPLTQPAEPVDELAAFIAQQIEPFTFRATLDPYRIHQLPEFLMHSHGPSDIVFQRSVFAPGPGGWHTHPGPSFVYVLDGQIKLQKFTENDGCFETRVYGPGEAYFEVGEQVHRAIVVSETPAVLLVARFNIPVGGPISTSVPNPGCTN